MEDAFFKKTNKKGEPLRCKFCGKEVWYHILGRWYETGGDVLHVENCEKRKAYYKAHAADASESRRQSRER